MATKKVTTKRTKKMSEAEQIALYEKVKENTEETPLGDLLSQMGRLVTTEKHQADVYALVDKFHSMTEEMPSNHVAAAVSYLPGSQSMPAM